MERSPRTPESSPRTVKETTTSALVPGAQFLVAFSKLGLDASEYLKGEDPDRGYYTIDTPLVLPESFPEVLAILYRIQDSGSKQARAMAAALIDNLTTRNDITNEELTFLIPAAQGGGLVQLRKMSEQHTPGLAKALGNIRYKGSRACCDFQIPVYPGRYPKVCPECGAALDLARGGNEEDSGAGLGPAGDTEEFNWDDIGESSPFVKAQEVFTALKVLRQRVRLVAEAGLNESAAAKTFPLLQGASDLQRCIVGDAVPKNHKALFESLVSYLMESGDSSMDRLVGVLFTKFPIEAGMTERLREEVKKRPDLVKSIQASISLKDQTRRYFVLNKALSSCFTRVMIEGESRGGDSYKFMGKCILEMMHRALGDDLQGSARFLNTFFLEG